MSILSEFQPAHNLVLITSKKTTSQLKHIEEIARVTFQGIFFTNELYETIVQPVVHKTWIDFYNNEDWFSSIPNVKMCIMFGGQLSTATGINRKLDRLNYILTTKQQMNFMANGTIMCVAVQMIKTANVLNVPFAEIVYDTLENSYQQVSCIDTSRVVSYHGYGIPRYNIKRLDSLQHYLLSYINPFNDIRDNEKVYDIVFGYTALTEDREKQYDVITEFLEKVHVDGLKVKTFVRHKRLNIDTFMDRDSYLEYISKAKYTFIIPPYDETQFSIYRFIESINYNCLPFIGNDVKIDEFINSFDLDEKLVNKLVFDYKRLPDISESDRLEMIEYFKQKVLKFTEGF